MSEKPISPLCQFMLEPANIRGLVSNTQREFIAVESLATFLAVPRRRDLEDLRVPSARCWRHWFGLDFRALDLKSTKVRTRIKSLPQNAQAVEFA